MDAVKRKFLLKVGVKMAEYIERDEGMDIGTLEDWYINSIDITVPPIWTIEHLEELLEDFIVIPKETPSADVRPERHGRWVSWEEAGNFIPSPDRYECSICHDAAERLCNGFDLLSSYCPNCGAKMDGKGGENNG